MNVQYVTLLLVLSHAAMIYSRRATAITVNNHVHTCAHAVQYARRTTMSRRQWPITYLSGYSTNKAKATGIIDLVEYDVIVYLDLRTQIIRLEKRTERFQRRTGRCGDR